MSDIFDYATSPLSPALKILVFFIFLAATIVYVNARRKFGGHMQESITLLFLFSLFMAIGALLRYFGHGTDFGFSSDFSLKWFQSLVYIIAVIFLILAGKKLFTLFQQGGK